MKINPAAFGRHYLQTLAFCLLVAGVQIAFQPARPQKIEIALVYSLCIGTCIWALIDGGRHLFASSTHTGWPQGVAGWLLAPLGIAAGYGGGMLAGDLWFGWSSWSGTGPHATPLPLSLAIAALAGTAGTFYFYSIGKSRYLQRQMTEAHRHANEARLKLLETQLEPHMLFNTLANLRVLMGTDPTRAQTMLDHLVAYLRATLDASRATTHPLATEFDRLRDYLELMAVRMGPRLQVTLDLAPELSQVPVPTLLLQPLVENSIKHGLEPQVAGGHITVTARAEGGQLRIDVADTGRGLQAPLNPDASPASGFGLALVRERLHTLYGSLGTLELIANNPTGTRAKLKFPLEPVPQAAP